MTSLMTLTLGVFIMTWAVGVSSSPLETLRRMKRQNENALPLPRDCALADVVFLLDSSGSIKLRNWNKILDFVADVIGSFVVGPNDVQVGVAWYSNRASVAFHMNESNSNKDALEAVAKIPWKDQETNTSGAIRLMYTDMFSARHGDRGKAPNIGIVITDGVSNRDEKQTVPEANAARKDGIQLFAIGIGDEVSPPELQGIANKPSRNFVFNATDFDALQFIRQAVVTAACEAVADCAEDADFAFVLDSSGSVGADNFDKEKAFLKDMINELNVDNGMSRVSLVTFSDSARVEFHLNTHSVRDDMAEAILWTQYEAGTTNTAAALRLVREEVFSPARGDRPDVRDVIVLFTDGNSNDLEATLREAVACKLRGMVILVVAVSDWINKFEINEIASDPDDLNVHYVDDFDRIPEIASELRHAMCNDYNECASEPCKNGGTCLDLINIYQCWCPEGFAGRYCDIPCEDNPDVVLALDSSTSVGESRYGELLHFAKDLVANLNVGQDLTRVAVETYATDAVVRYHLNELESKRDAVNAISFLFMMGQTNTAEALRRMREDMFVTRNGDRPGNRNVGIVVTDGHSSDRASTQAEAAMMRAQPATLLAVGVGVMGYYNNREMQGIASDPDDKNFLSVPDFWSLPNLTIPIINAVCNNVDECASNPCQGGALCINKVNAYECQCPVGRTGINCERVCDGQLDLAFVLDASGSIRHERFPRVRDFVKGIVSQLEVREGRVRVGLVKFSDSADMGFYLNSYNTKEDVLNAIEGLTFMNGRTHTASALQMMRNQLFNIANGDRPDVPNIAVIITDGLSNVNPESTLPQAIQARVQGTHMIVASIENDPANLELQGLASDPRDNNVFNVDRYSQLPGLVSNIVQATCNDLDECSSSPCGNGGTCFDGLGQFICRCRDEYTGTMCERRCTRSKDIVFVLDASGSVETNFDLIQKLTREIVWGLNFAGGRTRIGVLTYQRDVIIRFHLNSYNLKESVLNAIAFTHNPHEVGTNTASALFTAHQDMFTPSNGDRTGVDNVIVVITDGRSNIMPEDTVAQAQNARRMDIRVVAVGVGGEVSRAEVDGMADDPDSMNAFYMWDESEIREVAGNILRELCT